MNHRKKKSGFISILLGCSLLLTGCDTVGNEIVWKSRNTEESHSELLPVADQNVTEICTDKGYDFESEEAFSEEKTVPIYADICGAVKIPGVYELDSDARIFELIEKAGGLCEDADLTSVNQAERVTDGMKVRVYTKEEAASLPQQTSESSAVSGAAAQTAKININTADVSQLTQLTGIGEARAADIIAYRTEHGKFLTIEEIMNVSGIKESTFQKIKDEIVVE